MLGTEDGLGAAGLPGAREALDSAELVGSTDAPVPLAEAEAELLGAVDTLGATDTLGAGEPLGGTDGQPMLAAGLGEGDADGMTVGGGVGRNPTGLGPTRTKAARMPNATRTPTSRPATTVTPVFIAAEGTSTDGRGRRAGCRC